MALPPQAIAARLETVSWSEVEFDGYMFFAVMPRKGDMVEVDLDEGVTKFKVSYISHTPSKMYSDTEPPTIYLESR